MMATTTYKSFSVEHINRSIHTLRLTVKNSPVNLMNATFLTEFHGYLTTLESAPIDLAPKLIVVNSADPDIWLHHLDLRFVSAKYPLPASEGDAHHFLHLLEAILSLLNNLPTIFVAEVNGLAVGGGNEFALNMDMRFAGPKARFGVPEVVGGIVHGGGVQKLTQLVGAGRSLEMMLSSRAVDATEASRIGLVNRAFGSADEMRKHIDALATRIALSPAGGTRATKVGVHECVDGTGSMGKDMQRLGELAHTEVAQLAISAFMELGEHQTKSGFELALPDSGIRAWQ